MSAFVIIALLSITSVNGVSEVTRRIYVHVACADRHHRDFFEPPCIRAPIFSVRLTSTRHSIVDRRRLFFHLTSALKPICRINSLVCEFTKVKSAPPRWNNEGVFDRLDIHAHSTRMRRATDILSGDILVRAINDSLPDLGTAVGRCCSAILDASSVERAGTASVSPETASPSRPISSTPVTPSVSTQVTPSSTKAITVTEVGDQTTQAVDTDDRSSGLTKTQIIIIAVASSVGAILLVITIFAFYCTQHRRRHHEGRQSYTSGYDLTYLSSEKGHGESKYATYDNNYIR